MFDDICYLPSRFARRKIIQKYNVLFHFSLSNLNGLPKSLLPICGKPLISHWIDSFENIEVIDEVIVVTNNHFLDFFLDWKSKLETAKKGSVSFLDLIKEL